ncbi:fructosamine kinase family protein [Solitalea sp. MAHUQ-68]|uniref:Fructosamine kinase family protein n=1 Tax=Solitalea agri TaxID=2953739 RepID=A0A9X2JDF3_9SPHI|nr:fructosamine kinase family protein [Solitalea agri]MCO4294412.1 fructosamine kinase family protein [Solitalea agri]
MKNVFQQAISQVLNKEVSIDAFHQIEGGSISNAARIDTNEGRFFIKWNDASYHKMFETEEFGLQKLRSFLPALVPQLLGSGLVDYTAFIVLEWIDPDDPKENYWEDFGEKLALLHQNTHTNHGLDHTNFIGSLPQYNPYGNSWIDFFITNRLQVLVEAAFNKNLLNNTHLKMVYALYSKLYSLIPEEKPSLLHGDLWSGNVLCGNDGLVKICDPAVYYGHREMDLAMSTLFGAFNNRFYETYNEHYPLVPGYKERFDIHNLYPLLVHLNLFGFSYLNPIEQILKNYA